MQFPPNPKKPIDLRRIYDNQMMKEAESIAQAIIELPANGGANEKFDPLKLKIYGLTVLERTLKALEKAGVGHVSFLANNHSAQVKKFIEKTKPWSFATEILQGNSVAEVFKKVPSGNSVLWFKEPLVLDPSIPTRMMEEGSKKNGSVLTTSNNMLAYGSTNALGRLNAEDSKEPGQINTDKYCHTIRNQEELKSAKRSLLGTLIKPTDGWVSRNLNRPVSISISRLLTRTSITPNQFTWFTAVLAVLTAVFLAQGGYWGFMLGGLMYHLTSVLDGVDGELARLKFKSSPFGQWLDTTVDNASHILALIGYLIGLFQGGISDLELAACLLSLFFVLFTLASLYYYVKKYDKGGTFLTVEYSYQEGNSFTDRILKFLAPLGRRDLFALIFFLLALIGQLRLALVFLFVMTGIIFGLSINAHVLMRKKLADKQYRS